VSGKEGAKINLDFPNMDKLKNLFFYLCVFFFCVPLLLLYRIKNISAYNADEDVWPVIRNASKNGQLKHVKYSPDGGRGVDSDTLFLFRNSLKEFFLSDSTAQRGPNNSAFRLISQRLDEFPNLTKLFTPLKTNRDIV
jgi:hypothetical protein